MNEVFLVLFGIAVGTRYAESIRDHVPALDPKPIESPPKVAK